MSRQFPDVAALPARVAGDHKVPVVAGPGVVAGEVMADSCRCL